MTESEAIQARHSVRKYLGKPIEAEKIEAIRKCIDLCNHEGGVHFQLVINEPKAFRNSIDWRITASFRMSATISPSLRPKEMTAV